MSEQPPQDPTPTEPYGSPPPPPATNPYAAPPAGESAPPPVAPVNPYSTPGYGAPPPTYGTPPPPPGYAAPTYAAPGYPSPAASSGSGGLAITALVFSIIAALICWIPFISFLALVLALVGLVLGIVAWSKAGKTHRPKGMAVAATIVSALALLVAIAMSALTVWLAPVFIDCSDSTMTSDQQERCIEDGLDEKFGA